ncbi:hypothetical protein [Micromonospora pisi]|uniref:hypothetical protein n=1 Tax=Micromonospora pisi TaxID=589240 RepID=UPI000EB1A954|nr:hypothetical protein [Micromonospora pisi]
MPALIAAIPAPRGNQAAARATHAPTPSPTATDTPTPVGRYAARLPKLPAAPPPKPVTLPAAGSAPWYSRVPTDQPMAFITIDDGWIKRPEARELLVESGVPV